MSTKKQQNRIKFIWLIVMNLLFVSNAIGQQKYLAIYYFKYTGLDNSENYNRRAVLMPSLDDADFFRLLLPPSDGDRRFNVQEYYANGKIKLIGKILPADTTVMKDWHLDPDGECAEYYPDGKKKSLINYVSGRAMGDEYLFYPSGKVYQYMVNEYYDVKRIDCYDINGNQVCNGGNGQWIEYSNHFKNIVVQGPVVNNYREGEWKQQASWPDSISGVIVYKKDRLAESYGIDRKGIKYPFVESFVHANVKGGPVAYIQSIRSHLKVSVEDNALIDTMHISFIIEKDGSVNTYQVLGIVSPELKESLINAVKLCRNWTTAKLYGVPLKVQIVLPMIYNKGYIEDKSINTMPTFYGGLAQELSGIYYNNGVNYWERLLASN